MLPNTSIKMVLLGIAFCGGRDSDTNKRASWGVLAPMVTGVSLSIRTKDGVYTEIETTKYSFRCIFYA